MIATRKKIVSGRKAITRYFKPVTSALIDKCARIGSYGEVFSTFSTHLSLSVLLHVFIAQISYICSFVYCIVIGKFVHRYGQFPTTMSLLLSLCDIQTHCPIPIAGSSFSHITMSWL